MAFTVDYGTNIGKVRALIGDVDAALPFLSDEQIAAFLAMEGDELKLAASDALMAMASMHAIIMKKMELLELKRDGTAVAESLRKLAKQYREEVLTEPFIDFADTIPPPLNRTALIWGLPDEARSWSSDAWWRAL